jgi:predicted membrane protein
MDNQPTPTNKENSRLFGGLILVTVGAALLLRNMNFGMPNWLLSWPMLLIVIGIFSGIKHNFRNNAWIILIAIGGFFFVSKYVFPGLELARMFWPVIIIGIGLLLILRPRGSNFLSWEERRNRWQQKKNDNDNKGINTAFSNTSYRANHDDVLQVRCVFSGIETTMLTKNFQGGTISTVFGGVDVDLTQADFNGNIKLHMDVIFGGVKLLVPAGWVIKNEIDGVFHGVEDKRRQGALFTPDSNKLLVLKGSVLFGGIDIKNY